MESTFLFILGLIVGSFLAAFTYRFPRGISIRKGRSFCPCCRVTIGWRDNIPLFSYLLLGGRCRHCHKKISPRYPLIEIATALIFVFIGPNIFLLTVSCLLIAIAIIDIEEMIIPDELVFAGLGLTFLFKLASSDFYASFFAGSAGAVFLLLIHLITRGRGMGLGDVKLVLLLGSVLGISLLPLFLLVSFLTGGAVASILLVTGRANMKQRIAFGPFLVTGYFITWFVSQTLQFRFF